MDINGFDFATKDGFSVVKNAIKNVEEANPEFLNCVNFDFSKIENFLVKNKNYETMIVVGIGGSSLGAKAILSSILPFSKKVIFLENVDGFGLKKIENLKLDEKKIIITMISKSGSTLETDVNFGILRLKYPESKIVFVTSKGSDLDKFSSENNHDCFYIPEKLGGRFSVFSNVGFLPLCFAGIDCKKLLFGAQNIIYLFLKEKNKYFINYTALHLDEYVRGKNTFVLFSYGERFRELNEWWKQLIGESLGKSLNVGPNPMSCIGSIDQHSMLQLFAEGPDDKIFTFLFSKSEGKDIDVIDGNQNLSDILNACKMGTALSLNHKKKTVLGLEIDDINELYIGKLILFFEIFVAVLADCFKIDAYNQPGVEYGKQQTKRILKEKNKK